MGCWKLPMCWRGGAPAGGPEEADSCCRASISGLSSIEARRGLPESGCGAGCVDAPPRELTAVGIRYWALGGGGWGYPMAGSDQGFCPSGDGTPPLL